MSEGQRGLEKGEEMVVNHRCEREESPMELPALHIMLTTSSSQPKCFVHKDINYLKSQSLFKLKMAKLNVLLLMNCAEFLNFSQLLFSLFK
jgi:hypothetical protein